MRSTTIVLLSVDDFFVLFFVCKQVRELMREHNEELLKCIPIFYFILFYFFSRKFIEHLYFCTRRNTIIVPALPPKQQQTNKKINKSKNKTSHIKNKKKQYTHTHKTKSEERNHQVNQQLITQLSIIRSETTNYTVVNER